MWRVVLRHSDGWHRVHCRWRPWHLVNLAATMVHGHRHEVDLFHSHGAAATLTHHGPAGWLTLGAAAAILAMPALTATPPGSPRPRPAPGPCTTPSASACNGDGASPAPATSPPPSPRSPASASRNPALSPATCTAPGAGLPSVPVMASSALALSPLPRAPAASSPSAPAPPGTPVTNYATPPVVPPSSTSTPLPSTRSSPPVPPEHETPTARQVPANNTSAGADPHRPRYAGSVTRPARRPSRVRSARLWQLVLSRIRPR